MSNIDRSGDVCPLCQKAKQNKSNSKNKTTNENGKNTHKAVQTPNPIVSIAPATTEGTQNVPIVDLSEAERLKEAGNKHIAAQAWELAQQAYTSALALLPPVVHPQQLDSVNTLKLALYLNLGHVGLKQTQWGQTITNCTSALAIDPHNRKGLFRRGMARVGKNSNVSSASISELKLACRDLDDALRAGPPSKEISQSLAAARERLELTEQHERESLGIERLKKDIEDMPDDQVSVSALMKQMEAMSRQLPGSSLAKAMDDIRSPDKKR